MVDLQTVGVVVAAASVTVAAVYYMFTLRMNMRTQQLALKSQEQNLETRQAQLFMQMYQLWVGKEYQASYIKVMSLSEDIDDLMRIRKEDPDLYTTFISVSNFYEGVGVLVKRGLVDKYMVDDLMSGYILSFWERYQHLIKEFRVRRNWPQMYEWVEYLYNEIKAIAVTQHPELATKKITTQ